MDTLPPLPPGHYLDDRGDVIRVTVNRAGTRSYAQRMVLTADADGVAIVEWEYCPGLGRDLLLTDLTPREVSRRVRAAIAA